MSTINDNTGSKLDDMSIEAIEAELKQFELDERKRLGLPVDNAKQWFDAVPRTFTREQREHTTILVSGLTMAHDLFIQAALRGIGYKVLAMDVPDNDALQFGREYGNRGQCNPTYFTVGNLVKYLDGLRERGMNKDEIVKNHVFITAGACGPCRFGTYVTEYRKALRDSGFDGFRVLLFQQTGGLKQATGEGVGLEMNPTFFWGVVRAILIGDVLNSLGYRIRPYEVEPGATDRALETSKRIISQAFEQSTSLPAALWKVRRELSKVKVDRTRTKPRVGIIGEFWAMTTEGDGNYGLQRFLEAEGAEPDIQIVTSWLLYMIWQGRYDTEQRATLRGVDKAKDERGGSKFSLKGVDVRKRTASLWAGEQVLRGLFQVIAKGMGLNDYHLPDMDQIAEVSHAFYDNNLRGGEGHMEIGKLIQNVAYSKVNMTLSVKPFGCMPSSSVSDGDQRRRCGQRVQPRADAAVQGQAAGPEGSRQGACRRRHDHRRGARVPPQASVDDERVPSLAAQGGLHRGRPRLRSRRPQEPAELPQGAHRRPGHRQGHEGPRRGAREAARDRAPRGCQDAPQELDRQRGPRGRRGGG